MISPVIPAIGQWAQDETPGLEVMDGLSSMTFHLRRLTWLWLLLSAKLASSREEHGGRLIILDPCHHGKGITLSFMEQICILVVDVSPAHNSSTQITIHGRE